MALNRTRTAIKEPSYNKSNDTPTKPSHGQEDAPSGEDGYESDVGHAYRHPSKWLNTIKVIFGIIIPIGGFLVFLCTKLNVLDKNDSVLTDKLNSQSIEITFIKNDVKDSKYSLQSIDKSIDNLSTKLDKIANKK